MFYGYKETSIAISFFHASGIVTCAGAPGKLLFASFAHRQHARQHENPATELLASPLGFFSSVITTRKYSLNPVIPYTRWLFSSSRIQCMLSMSLRVSFNLCLLCRTVLFIPSFNDLTGYFNVSLHFVAFPTVYWILIHAIPNYALKHTYQLRDMASILAYPCEQPYYPGRAPLNITWISCRTDRRSTRVIRSDKSNNHGDCRWITIIRLGKSVGHHCNSLAGHSDCGHRRLGGIMLENESTAKNVSLSKGPVYKTDQWR